MNPEPSETFEDAGLLQQLSKLPVELAIYKGVADLEVPDGHGCLDLDLTAEPQVSPELSRVFSDLGGIRGIPHPLYDNAIPSRRDWFFRFGESAMLHLDIASPVVVGRKFSKRYAVEGIDRTNFGARSDHDGNPIPIASPEDRTRLALAKFAFNASARPFSQWVDCPVSLGEFIGPVIPHEASATWCWRNAGASVDCAFRNNGTGLQISAQSLRTIRHVIRRANGASPIAPVADELVHLARRTGYALVSRLGRASSSSILARRRLETGAVIALIGPDGVGKSTQSRALAGYFGQKLACASIYLGSNDGSWMRFRRKLRPSRRQASSTPSRRSRDKSQRGWLHAHGSALWRLIIAIQRRLALRKALRLARSGAIAIADRWPQVLEPGMLDGPSVKPPAKWPLARLLSAREWKIYRAMARYQPDLTIHLDCDFATSYARKPGDIEPDAFAARIALMERMRAQQEGVVVVDARAPQEKVFADLLDASWAHLHSVNRPAR